jgi:TerC family integral membrane protein
MSPWLPWIGLFALLAVLLWVDLRIVHRRPHVMPLREALGWSGVWVGLALLFNLGVLLLRGPKPALEFLTGYLIEQSLSVDNLFVFMLIFSTFRVPAEHQHRVLYWGILGAIVMRLGFIIAGVSLVQRVHAVIYVFGAILVVSGIRMWSHREAEIHPERNPVIRLFRRFWPVTGDYVGGNFFVRLGGRTAATPLLVALLMVETTDLLFAVDSIPAVLAITRDPFIVFSSNVFAILGLRTFYFALAEAMRLFHYLHYGLSFILVFVGAKMLLVDVVEIPTGAALAVIGLTLLACAALSRFRPPRLEPPPA